ELPDGRVEVDRRDVLQPADLLAHLLDNQGLAMTDRDRDNACEAVEVLLPAFVPEVLHVAFDDQQRLAIVGDESRRQILPAQRKDLVARGAVVRSRHVGRDRKRYRLRGRSRYVARHGGLRGMFHTPYNYNWTRGP